MTDFKIKGLLINLIIDILRTWNKVQVLVNKCVIYFLLFQNMLQGHLREIEDEFGGFNYDEFESGTSNLAKMYEECGVVTDKVNDWMYKVLAMCKFLHLLCYKIDCCVHLLQFGKEG